MLEFVAIRVGEGAPLGCARCHTAPAPVFGHTDDLVRRIRAAAASWRGGPGPNILLTGPEPFAHPALPDLVIACQEAGVQRIAIETDARALAALANAEGALGAGVTHLRVRLLAAEASLADSLSGRPESLVAAQAGVEAYRAAAERQGVIAVVTVVLPVCVHNVDTTPATVGRLSAWGGIDAVRLIEAGALPGRAGGVLAAACDTGMVNRLWVECAPGLPLPETHVLHQVEKLVHNGD